MYRGQRQPGGNCVRDYLPVYGQGLREGVLDHWHYHDCDQSVAELDQADSEGADWGSLKGGGMGLFLEGQDQGWVYRYERVLFWTLYIYCQIQETHSAMPPIEPHFQRRAPRQTYHIAHFSSHLDRGRRLYSAHHHLRFRFRKSLVQTKNLIPSMRHHLPPLHPLFRILTISGTFPHSDQYSQPPRGGTCRCGAVCG